MASRGKRDYYEVLEVGREADTKEIRQAFRRLARKYHPDVNPGDQEAEARFKELSEAYRVLSDEQKRREYDQHGRIPDFGPAGGGGYPGGFTWQTTAGPDFDHGGFGNMDDLLEELLGRTGRGARRRRGQDVQAEVELTLEEAYRGAARQVTVPLPHPCPACGGLGAAGAGGPCTTCGGRGQLEQTKRLEVKIPPGVRTGSRIRVAGQGMPGSGGDRGDLYLIPRVAPHPRFERRGDDLHCEVEVSYPEAALGAEIEAPLLEGRATVKLPPGTSSGQRLRLAGKGMPRVRGGGHGDLYVRVRIVVPKDMTLEEKELVERLGRMRPGRSGANPRARQTGGGGGERR